MLSFNPGNILEVDVESPIDRPMIILRTLQGALLNLPWGTGFGTFPLAYPPLEQVADIFSSVVNHAHNDFAELLLEGGIPAGLLLVLYLALLAVRLPALAGSSFRTALFLSITFVLIHSLVDYPLRTIGLGVVFAAFNGILFARREPAPARAAAAARAALPALRKAG
jgi:O-antigen ligase